MSKHSRISAGSNFRERHSAIPNQRERFSLLAGRSDTSARGVLLDRRKAANRTN